MSEPQPHPERPDPVTLDGWVAAAQAGDAEAFDRLVLALHRPVRLAIAAYAMNADQIEEVLQQAWVTAFEQLARYERRGTFLPWVKGIARNLLREDMRERGRLQRASSGDALDHLMLAAVLADLEEPEPDARSSALLVRLRPCIDALSPRARTLLLARDRDREGLPSLARRFKQNKEALATALWRIRQTVRRCLETSA